MARIPTIYDFDGMPAGSFTWWFGLASKVPTGWLILDGSTFSATEYPELYAVLGTNVLPRLTDGRFIKGGTTSKVTENAGLPSLSADVSNLSFSGTQSTIQVKGTPSGTISENGSHTHTYNQTTGSGENRDGDNDGGYAIVNLSSQQKNTGEAGAHTHTFTGNEMTLSATYTPQGTITGTVNYSGGSIYGSSDTVTPLNITAIPIIKAGSRNIYYTDEEIGRFVNSLESRIAALERNTSNLGATPMDVHNTTLSAHNGFNTKANVSTVETLTGRVQGLQERLETLENEETGE